MGPYYSLSAVPDPDYWEGDNWIGLIHLLEILEINKLTTSRMVDGALQVTRYQKGMIFC